LHVVEILDHGERGIELPRIGRLDTDPCRVTFASRIMSSEEWFGLECFGGF